LGTGHTDVKPTEVLLRPGELAVYLEEIVLHLEHCPVAEGSQELPVAHIAGKGKNTAPAVVVEAVQEPALPSAVVVLAAVHSWLLRLGTTVPTLPSWPPDSAVEVAGLEPVPVVEECTTADSCTPLVAEVRERQHTGLLAVMALRRVLANLHYCCLHKR
jgi:hypothetical protein